MYLRHTLVVSITEPDSLPPDLGHPARGGAVPGASDAAPAPALELTLAEQVAGAGQG